MGTESLRFFLPSFIFFAIKEDLKRGFYTNISSTYISLLGSLRKSESVPSGLRYLLPFSFFSLCSLTNSAISVMSDPLMTLCRTVASKGLFPVSSTMNAGN